MPKRRVTKATNRRARPKLPEGDEGKDFSEKQRREKLRVFLADFDLEFKEKLRILEEEKRQLVVDVDVQYHALISLTPATVRQMKMEDFIISGGTVQAAMLWLKQSGQDSSMPDISASIYSTKTATKKHYKLDSICEYTSVPGSSSNMSVVKKTGRSRRTKKPLDDSTNMPPPSTSSNRSSRFRTPARGPNSFGLNTPIITPKFNPCLPNTPRGLRRPKPGERLVSMDGSPVSVDTTKSAKTRVISLAVGSRTLDLPEIPADLNLDQLSIPDMEGDTSENINRLYALLKTYMQKSGTA